MFCSNINVHVSATSDEYDLLQRAHACSKEILNYVNQAVRDCENHQKLVNFQRRLDKRSIENSTHPVILEYKVKPAPTPSPSALPVILEYKVKPAPTPLPSALPVILEYKVKPAPTPLPSALPVILEYKVKPAPTHHSPPSLSFWTTR